MTARGYEQDEALRILKERIRRLELKEARNRPAGGVDYNDDGGNFGGGTITIADVLALIGAGTAPGSFLRTTLGGVGNVQELGNLGATETLDLANGNYFWGTLDQACTIGFTGWTNLKDCWIVVELIENGTGGWTPTFSGVTWEGNGGAVPVHPTTAGTFTRYIFHSRDGGTTIVGNQAGADTGSSGDFLTNTLGEQAVVSTTLAAGSSYTADLADGNVHDITLTAACALVLTGSTPGVECEMLVLLRQDATGSRTVTWPAGVLWPGGVAPTLSTAANAVDAITLATVDGGANWYGVFLSGGGTLNGLTDVTITTPAENDTLRYIGAVWVNDNRRWEPVTADLGSGYEYILDGSEPLMEWKEY